MNPLQTAAGRLGRGLITWPDARGWRDVAGIAVVTAGAMPAIGAPLGFVRYAPRGLAALAPTLPVIFVAPALLEESVFRGLFVPDRSENARPWLAIALVTAAFTLWHAIEALTFLPRARPIFLTPGLLGCAAALGAGCAIARWRTGSLWPPILMHWLTVAAWQGLFGGPAVPSLW
ncbi:MAG TPA: CPBP family glutamic-type intramembrane protease [Caulobacteraceae bacterium]|nr:CPBP family glutamic-type intramembrane protease [Caulobacteraceae bacterium]